MAQDNAKSKWMRASAKLNLPKERSTINWSHLLGSANAMQITGTGATRNSATSSGSLDATADGLIELAKSYESIPMRDGHSDGAHSQSKYTVTPEGALVTVNRLGRVDASAAVVLEMLWDDDPELVSVLWSDLEYKVVSSAHASGEVMQRLLHLQYPAWGKDMKRRDAVVLTNAYHQREEKVMFFNSVQSKLVPEDSAFVRSDVKVLGFVALPLSSRSCSLFMMSEFHAMGEFSSPLMRCVLGCTGGNMQAARDATAANAHTLLQIKNLAEASVTVPLEEPLSPFSGGEQRRQARRQAFLRDAAAAA